MPKTDRANDMFSSRFKRHAAQFAISAALAVGTPAAAAGLVEGVRVAATTVDQAANTPTVSTDDTVAPATAPQPAPVQVATHASTRLSALAVSPSKLDSGAKPEQENRTLVRAQ